jgi:hypothetical protein
MSTEQAHRFAGMDVEPNEPPLAKDPPGPRRYRGRCACGHVEHWTTNKDWAWEEIAAHFEPLIRRFASEHPVGRT